MASEARRATSFRLERAAAIDGEVFHFAYFAFNCVARGSCSAGRICSWTGCRRYRHRSCGCLSGSCLCCRAASLRLGLLSILAVLLRSCWILRPRLVFRRRLYRRRPMVYRLVWSTVGLGLGSSMGRLGLGRPFILGLGPRRLWIRLHRWLFTWLCERL
jgi:hypothetical protein